MDMDKEREKRYYLVGNELFELIVNFKLMTINLYKVDKRSQRDDDSPMSESIILSNTLTINGHIAYDDLYQSDKNTITYNCMGLIRKVLNFKYSDQKNVMISTFEDYQIAYDRWHEVLDEEKKSKEIKECTLENIILEEDVKEDILSTINFVKNIEKYKEMGCVIPSGILLEGPPGTGKTLIAKTVANESNMNFKSLIASDLVQKYVGDSAKRIEKEFEEITKAGGGILFIDEIDAIGMNRSSSDENKEYRAALNKLLACMSEASEKNVIVICATNVKEQLDPALIREGRIDKVIKVPLPDFDSRVKLFELYVNKLKHEDNINYEELAEKTDGKSGAFIAACCNHAGIYAVDHDATKTGQEHIDHVLKRMIDNREECDEHQTGTIGFV